MGQKIDPKNLDFTSIKSALGKFAKQCDLSYQPNAPLLVRTIRFSRKSMGFEPNVDYPAIVFAVTQRGYKLRKVQSTLVYALNTGKFTHFSSAPFNSSEPLEDFSWDGIHYRKKVILNQQIGFEPEN